MWGLGPFIPEFSLCDAEPSVLQVPPTMGDSERLFAKLIFDASNKYASWDPEVEVEVGDWGRFTGGGSIWAFLFRKRGVFIKEGNIYKDGTAKEFDIPPPKDFGADASDGVTWIVSDNGKGVDISGSLAHETPVLAQCKIKAGYNFSSSQGAVIAMNNDTLSKIDPPASLRRLLYADKMQGTVIVSEVHRCSSYARLLTSKEGGTVVIGLSIESPVSGMGAASVDAKWVRNSSSGNFKSKVNNDGARTFYPLFRLSSLMDTDLSSGLRQGYEDVIPPLPDATPPWTLEGLEKEPPSGYSETRQERRSWKTISKRLRQGPKN